MILTFDKKDWTTTINDLLVDYAKNNNIDYYFNHYFKLVLVMNNIAYTVDAYAVLNNTLRIILKEI